MAMAEFEGEDGDEPPSFVIGSSRFTMERDADDDDVDANQWSKGPILMTGDVPDVGDFLLARLFIVDNKGVSPAKPPKDDEEDRIGGFDDDGTRRVAVAMLESSIAQADAARAGSASVWQKSGRISFSFRRAMVKKGLGLLLVDVDANNEDTPIVLRSDGGGFEDRRCIILVVVG